MCGYVIGDGNCRYLFHCIPDIHPHRVTNTKCRTNTVISPDEGHIVARSMQRKEINILRKIPHQLGFIYKMPKFINSAGFSYIRKKTAGTKCARNCMITTKLFI